MEPTEENIEKIRKILDKLFENAKTIEEITQLPFLIDDYIEEGYNVRDYIPRYNLLVQKFYSNNIKNSKKD